MVPSDLRAKVLTAWRSLFRSAQINNAEGERLSRLSRYREVRALAIEAVERKLHDGAAPDGVPAPAREL